MYFFRGDSLCTYYLIVILGPFLCSNAICSASDNLFIHSDSYLIVHIDVSTYILLCLQRKAVMQHLYLGRNPPMFTGIRVIGESTDDDHLVRMIKYRMDYYVSFICVIEESYYQCTQKGRRLKNIVIYICPLDLFEIASRS